MKRRQYQTRKEVLYGVAGMFYLWTLLALLSVGVIFFASDTGVQAWGAVGCVIFIILMNIYNAAGLIVKALTLPNGEGE